MQVINLNKNGEVIPDLTKITLSKELSEKIHHILNRREPHDPTKNDSEQQQH